MRIRTVKPEFWQDEDLAEISETARLVAIGLLNMADDEGFFNANEKLVSSLLFPLTEPSVSIHECLNQLVQSGYLKLYQCKKGKKVYGQVVNFLKHQKVNRPSPSKIKDLIEFTENSLNDHGCITVGKEEGTGNREQGTGIREMEGDSQKKHESNLPAKAGSAASDIQDAFNCWVQVMEKNTSTKLNKKREAAVRARLKEGYTIDQIKQAIIGCSKTPHNMGVNTQGKPWNDLELICRDGNNVERFMDNAHNPPAAPDKQFSKVTAGNIAMLEQFNPEDY